MIPWSYSNFKKEKKHFSTFVSQLILNLVVPHRKISSSSSSLSIQDIRLLSSNDALKGIRSDSNYTFLELVCFCLLLFNSFLLSFSSLFLTVYRIQFQMYLGWIKSFRESPRKPQNNQPVRHVYLLTVHISFAGDWRFSNYTGSSSLVHCSSLLSITALTLCSSLLWLLSQINSRIFENKRIFFLRFPDLILNSMDQNFNKLHSLYRYVFTRSWVISSFFVQKKISFWKINLKGNKSFLSVPFLLHYNNLVRLHSLSPSTLPFYLNYREYNALQFFYYYPRW